MGDVETIARILLRDRGVLITLCIAAAVLVPAHVLFAQRQRWSRARVFYAGLAGLGLSLVPAFTLARGPLDPIEWRSCILASGLSLGSAEALANVWLFAPAAFFTVLASQRIGAVLLAVAALSLCIEVVQNVTGIGACQTADVTRNLAGAVFAGFAAWLIMRCSRSTQAGGSPRQPRRRDALP